MPVTKGALQPGSQGRLVAGNPSTSSPLIGKVIQITVSTARRFRASMSNMRAGTDLTTTVEHKGRTLVQHVSNELRRMIASEGMKIGDRLPSEAKIAETHGVSRTVVREAISALRADGLLEARRGAGLFLTHPQPEVPRGFQSVDYARVSSIVELIELRTAVEAQAAALAAVRRSPQQEEEIMERHDEVLRCIKAEESTAAADFALHKAIADATNNPRFGEFMRLLGTDAIPRANLQLPFSHEYSAQLHKEHEVIVTAIANRDPEAARAAMEQHLNGSQGRYRLLLRQHPQE